jgi:hypothetical protein
MRGNFQLLAILFKHYARIIILQSSPLGII